MTHLATDERSQSPESVFTLPGIAVQHPGIRVHVRPESVFKIVRNTHNTSFNVKGEPIVHSPRDAIRCFYSTGLDAVAIGPFLLDKG